MRFTVIDQPQAFTVLEAMKFLDYYRTLFGFLVDIIVSPSKESLICLLSLKWQWNPLTFFFQKTYLEADNSRLRKILESVLVLVGNAKEFILTVVQI